MYNRCNSGPSVEIFKTCLTKQKAKGVQCLMAFSMYIDIIRRTKNISNPQLKMGQKDCKTTTCIFKEGQLCEKCHFHRS